MLDQSRPSSGAILIVDDDPDILRVFQKILVSHGYGNTLLANSGTDAVSLLNTYQEEISVVLLDLKMPGMDGIAVMRHLVNVHQLPIAIIVQTGHSEVLSREEFFALGTETVLATEYMTKPFDTSVLLKEVEKAFVYVERKRKALHREAEARLVAKLEKIESMLTTVQKNQHGWLAELGLELMKALVIALALLALLYLGVDDFVRKVLPK